ncbi:hypothetical protein EN739_29895 [Mesorhizobium sp. M2A.F.Ca.ET.017.03.2.1]|uniref:hypothetical protein n=1 Tax=Mesorhizobium sp. M2A.F.Ca.ET.017.03.2.1 TaxID=2496650 RepID=UPI000FCBD15E|nr:hypothetical protein [Mesorhizobium sp. M2A.F.Ca.ET.017.03.2.1]RVC91405.1 hypothetical protein EN739_29895 [Mesorhizobium sp. M2A.F.Ca.ET.017.03.2.1]
MSMLTVASQKPSLWLERDIDQPEAVTSAREARTGAEPTASVQIKLTARQALCLRWRPRAIDESDHGHRRHVLRDGELSPEKARKAVVAGESTFIAQSRLIYAKKMLDTQ